MNFLEKIKGSFLNVKRRFQENNFDNILWIVNVVPKLAGFSLEKDTVSAWFWLLFAFLLIYTYIVGSILYQMNYAKEAVDFFKSYVNVSLLALIATNSYWWIRYRKLMRSVLKKMKESDRQAISSPSLKAKHENMLSVVKKIALLFYACNATNGFVVYIPDRMNSSPDAMSMVPCPGLESLSQSPNKYICKTSVTLLETCIMIANLNYQVLTMVLISHTAIMYRLLSKEIMMFNVDHKKIDINALVKEKLPTIIRRHNLILVTVDDLKSLYSVSIGVNFGSNAVCMCFFFFFEVETAIRFIPVLVYCFLVFFFNCLLCQQLTNASEEFERCVYSCGWENFKCEDQKTIYVMLLQSQKKIEVLAADIIPVNIYTFATTIQGIYKFVTVVKF